MQKKRNSERDIWRNSWGSGHSHASSCSIHSTATNGGGSGIGKDDFWAALQPNYNYIMDTNLLDSCREARCEFEGASAAASAYVQESCCEKVMLQLLLSMRFCYCCFGCFVDNCLEWK